MLNVVCVQSGNYQGCGADYVNRLYAMVARNLDWGTEGRFVCFTDDSMGIVDGVQIEPLPEDVFGWWNKLWLFSPGLFPSGDRVLYFDLDTVIVGALDSLAKYTGDFAILRDFCRSDGLQSSVMAWEAGWGTSIWHEWCRQGRPELPGGDQEWIEQIVGDNVVILQDAFPGLFCSYKLDCQPFPPETASIVCFHGEPKPHDCGRSWVDAMWTDSDTGHFHLNMVTNAPLDVIRSNIKHSEALGLPRLRSKGANSKKVAIVGGGPSAGDAITLAGLSRLIKSGAAVWALNGAYDWLAGHGTIADAHVLLDARDCNLTFIRNSRQETTYYIASQCSPRVYDELIRWNRDVVRLDLDVMGDCGTTVGTHAILTAFVEGFREIHLFGYDSSYREHAGHAYPQVINSGERIVDAHIGDRVFKAAPWMVRQAQDFEGISRDVVSAGGRLVVHGDGLLPYMAKMLSEAPPRAAVIRAREVLSRLPDKPLRGAEIGVFTSEMSTALLNDERLVSLLMVDSWEGDGAAYADVGDDFHARLNREHQEVFYRAALKAAAPFGDRAEVIRQRSVDAASHAKDHSLDFVFIDADHSYRGCQADIEAWFPKVGPGGLLSGHDYGNADFPSFGVDRAVDEFAACHGFRVELGENFTWFIRLPEGHSP